MDRTVPASAALLLDFIRRTEVGTEARSGYDVIFSFKQGEIAKPVTQMTVDEVLAEQAGWSKRFGSSAAGGYQFMRATLAGLKEELGLRSAQILDAYLQDRLGYHLLKRRGFEAYLSGGIDRTGFGRKLAQEWASFPVLERTKGAHRELARGETFYAGDKLNKALVKPEAIEALLDEVMRVARQPDPADPVPVTIPAPAPAKEAPVPAPSGNSPVEKAIGAGKGAATGAVAGGGLSGALILIGSTMHWLPEEANTAAFGAAVSIVLTGFSAFVLAVVGAYRAPQNGPI